MKYIELEPGVTSAQRKNPLVSFCAPEDAAGEKMLCSVIVAKHQGKWIFCRHKDRDTWEFPGGHIESGETPMDAAKRELFEETGALKADIRPVSVYSVADEYAMLFFAEVEELGNIPENSEMAEITMMESLPSNITYPKIQPALFEKVQGWLNFQSNAGEMWDVYDGSRTLTGRLHRRGDDLKKGEYHLVVHVWIQNSAGQVLITRRSPNKGFPLMWETTGGSALAGDDSLTAALREVREEMGVRLNPEKGKIVMSVKGDAYFADVWHFKQDVDISKVILQEGETCDVKWASFDEIMALSREGKFVPFICMDSLKEIFQGRQA